MYYITLCERGNNDEHFFENEDNKKEYLELKKRYKESYRFKLCTYCIISNHVHLLIDRGLV